MTRAMIEPRHCMTMADVRAGVDDIDRQLATLLTTRFAFMAAAARIKEERSAVRDEGRKAQVIANARANAEGYPPDVAARIWDVIVEESIAYELERFDGRGD